MERRFGMLELNFAHGDRERVNRAKGDMLYRGSIENR